MKSLRRKRLWNKLYCWVIFASLYQKYENNSKTPERLHPRRFAIVELEAHLNPIKKNKSNKQFCAYKCQAICLWHFHSIERDISDSFFLFFRFTHPQCRPITSIMNVLWCEYAVLTMASMASMIRCNAESVPIVMSVPQKSLSIEPTMPAMCKTPYFLRCSSSIRFSLSNSSIRLLHSWRNKFAPVNEPSPPITT